MMEQLWYTWSIEGLGGVAGYRVRAASGGLMNINSDRVRSFRSYLNYSLPQGSDPYAAKMETSPVCLAFADPANETTKDPNEQRNTHVIMQKVYKGKDAYGRAGVFFVHLADLMTDTPNDFVASDAIELWKSPFWRDSDTPPPPIENVRLGQIRREELKPHHEYQYLTQSFMDWLKKAEEDLKFIIQAFLLLKPGQKLYIAAPPDYVAILIWGLTHSLPRTLQQAQKLTFSTYEQDVTKATTRVVGTCQPMVTHQNASVKQQLLPADSLSGRGSALALDYYTGQRSPLEKGTEAATYAQFAIHHLLKGEKQILDDFLNTTDDTEPTQFMDTFNNYRTILREDLTPKKATNLLSNRKHVAMFLPVERVQNNMIDLCVKNPDWWREQGEPAIKKLRSPFDIPSEQPIKYALTALAMQAATKMANSMLDDHTPMAKATTKASQLLLFAAAPPDKELAPWIHLLQKFAEQSSRDQNFHPVTAFTWETYSWLLEQWTYGYGHFDNRLIRPWLLMDWPSLYKFLEMREKLPPEWRRTAIADTIFGYASIPSAPGEKRALFWMEDKRVAFPLFVEALQELMRDPRSRPAALWYYITLVKYGYKDKERYLLISLLTESSQIPDQDVDGFLEAAKLTSREKLDWLKVDRSKMLLAHRLTPSIAAIIQEYIDNLSLDKLDNAETQRILQLLYQHHAKLQNYKELASQVEDWYFASEWTLLKDEQTQLARNIEPDYLSKLSEAIQHLKLKNNKKFKESLLLLLIYNIRSPQNLDDVVAKLPSALSSNLFWELVKYRGEQYSPKIHSPALLMPYIIQTLTYAVRFQAQKKHEFLENALPQLLQKADTRTFEQIDVIIHTWNDEFQQLWSKYSQKLRGEKGIQPFYVSPSRSNQPIQNAAPIQKQPLQQAENRPIPPAPYQENQNYGNRAEQYNIGNQHNQMTPPFYGQPTYSNQETIRPETVNPFVWNSPEQSRQAASSSSEQSPILPEQEETNQPAQQNLGKLKAMGNFINSVSGTVSGAVSKVSQFIPPGRPSTSQTQPTSTEPEVGSNSMNAAIPEELVRRVHALKPLYINLRMPQIKNKLDKLSQQGIADTDGINDELDELRDHTDSEQTTRRMLENDRIIRHFLSNNADVKPHFDDLFPQVCDEVKKSSDYKKYRPKLDERDLEEMLNVFVRYRALCWYFKQQHPPQNMNVWLREQRRR